MDLSQPKRVFITGGASGLGKALALCFAKQGHKVCIVDLNDERGKQTLDQLVELSDQCFYRHCDVSSKEDISTCIAEVVERWQGIDVIINNAGVVSGGPFDWLGEDDWQWIMDINFFGVVRGCKAAIPIMKKQGYGHVVMWPRWQAC